MSAKAKKPTAKPTEQPQLAFFETTPLKLVVLSICTGGLYEMYWYYKMWRRAYPKAGKLGAIVRALFSRLFLYELLKNQQVPYAPWLAIAYFALGFAVQLPTFWGVVISYLTIVPLVYTQAHLNKRLKKPVKAPFTWRSIAVAVTGIILSILFFILASGYNANADQNNASTEQTAHHKVAQESTTKDQPANPAQSTEPTDNPASPDAATSSSSPSNTTASGTASAKKTNAASEPTVYPHADPDKIKQYASSFDPYPNAPQATSANVSLNSSCGSTGYYYDLHFIDKAKAGAFSAHWELVSGTAPYLPFFPQPSLGAGTIRIYDTLQDGFSAGATPYTVRLHVTSPNSVYSNSMTITSCS